MEGEEGGGGDLSQRLLMFCSILRSASGEYSKKSFHWIGVTVVSDSGWWLWWCPSICGGVHGTGVDGGGGDDSFLVGGGGFLGPWLRA